VVPEDCCAADSPRHHRDAVDMIERVLGADITASDRLDLVALQREPAREYGSGSV
jgi:nicotinamidase-related amidase